MRDLVIQEDTRSLQALEQEIDVGAFSRKTFGMYSGVDVKVQLQGTKNLAGVVLDRFGTDIWMHPLDEEHFSAAVTVTVSRQFFGWLTAIGSGLKIIGPPHVKEAYRSYLREILDAMDERTDRFASASGGGEPDHA
jgi:hypothetical protein